MRTNAKRHPGLEAKVLEVASWEATRVEVRHCPAGTLKLVVFSQYLLQKYRINANQGNS